MMRLEKLAVGFCIVALIVLVSPSASAVAMAQADGHVVCVSSPYDAQGDQHCIYGIVTCKDGIVCTCSDVLQPTPHPCVPDDTAAG